MPRVRGIGPMNRRDFLKLGGAGLAGATLLGVAGCGGGEQVGGGGGGGSSTFTYGRGGDSPTLDPIHATDGESFAVGAMHRIQRLFGIEFDALYRLDRRIGQDLGGLNRSHIDEVRPAESGEGLCGEWLRCHLLTTS